MISEMMKPLWIVICTDDVVGREKIEHIKDEVVQSLDELGYTSYNSIAISQLTEDGYTLPTSISNQSIYPFTEVKYKSQPMIDTIYADCVVVIRNVGVDTCDAEITKIRQPDPKYYEFSILFPMEV